LIVQVPCGEPARFNNLVAKERGNDVVSVQAPDGGSRATGIVGI